MPRFTAILPLYNKASTINRAIASVLSQSVGDVEVIVVDDGSTDGSVEAIDKAHLAAIRLVRQDNAGPGRARNAGAALATGELLARRRWDAVLASPLDRARETGAIIAARLGLPAPELGGEPLGV